MLLKVVEGICNWFKQYNNTKELRNKVLKLKTYHTNMGVHRLFSRGGQKFSRGGQEPTFCLKKQQKILFFFKKYKNIMFLAGHGGQEPPFAPPPADAHTDK
jgi:hypothetical protein